MSTKEEKLYEPIRGILERKFINAVGACRIWRTDRGQFPSELMKEIPIEKEILFSFGREAKPDLTGFVRIDTNVVDFITVEIEDGKAKLEDIYQAKRYADLWGAKYGFFITEEALPEKFRRLDRVSQIFSGFRGATIYSARYDRIANTIPDESWYPGSPFRNVNRDQTNRADQSNVVNLPPPFEALTREEPKMEDLQLRGATLLGTFGRLHIGNVGLRWVTINHYSIDSGEPHAFAPAVLIDAGLSGALTLVPNPGMKFERRKHYDIRVWSSTGTEFKFDVVFDITSDDDKMRNQVAFR